MSTTTPSDVQPQNSTSPSSTSEYRSARIEDLVAAYDAAIEKGTAKAHRLCLIGDRLAILQIALRSIQAAFGVGAVGGGILSAISNVMSSRTVGIILVIVGLIPILLSTLDAYNLREKYDKRWGLLRKALDAMVAERRGLHLAAGEYAGRSEQDVVNLGHARLTKLEADARDWS
jgi:hypothetical protein